MVPIERLADLQEAIRGRHEQGLFDEALYRGQYGFFRFDPPAELAGARSILVVAVPTPPMRVTFQWRGERVPVIIPPTYVSYGPRTENVQTELAAWLEEEGYGLARPQLPLKTLAVGSGLAEYGRNNITYVPGMGSFHQLVGAFSGLPCERDAWREPKALDRCDVCVACLRKCPTGAITDERFLIHAERCLTYHNEARADFPEWIDRSWHHCLVGCMRCQSACPENRAVKDLVEDRTEFSEGETGLLLRRVPLARLPAETAARWRNLDINEDYALLCRNLSVMIGLNRPAQ